MRMKKIFLALCLTIVSLSASAQFEQYTRYFNASLTGLNMSFNSNQKFNLGIDVTGGQCLADNWMLVGQLGYDHKRHDDRLSLGIGGRYYIEQNGLYLNLGVKYQYMDLYHSKVNNIMLTPEIGYCFFLNQYVTIEPALYYDLSMNHFSDYSTVGLRLGFGYYF